MSAKAAGGSGPQGKNVATARTVQAVLAGVESQPRGRSILPTGFSPLDDALGGGLRSGTLTLIGGVPGVGKTIAAMQWARSMARSGYGVVYACYEHDEPTLLGRLLLSELGDIAATDVRATSSEVRRMMWGLATGAVSLADASEGNEAVQAAHAGLQEYGDQLWLHASSPVRTDVDTLDALVPEGSEGKAVLFVDYLQKIPTDPGHAAIGLKDMAMRRDIAVIAIVAGDQAGLHRRRFRMQHLESAAALTYEADMVFLLNDKYAAVSKRHTAYDTVRAETFKQQVVVTIEKNREGPTGVNLGYKKDFLHYRFDPRGEHVEEQLVDEVIFLE
ncbi:MAG: DnaB-like helicase C-terminal domain-containing protein [Acidimicrobiia bacterium]